MMKCLLIIFLFLSPSLSWSEDIFFDDLVKRDGLYYQKFTDVPFTGKVVGRLVGEIKNGRKVLEGEWLSYHENGQLKFKRNYKDGKLEGEWLVYYENGQLEEKGNYKDDKQEGEWLVYNENGQLEEKGNYKDGKEEGEWLVYQYHENGQLEKTEIWKDSELINTIEH